MKLIIALCAAIVLAAPACARAPASVEAFGITVGSKLAIHECLIDPQSVLVGPKTYAYPSKDACWQHKDLHDIGRTLTSGDVFLSHPSSDAFPPWAGGVALNVRNGNVQGVTVYTPGAAAQRVALVALTNKYGKPSASHVENLQTGAGGQLQSIEATWNFPNLFVALHGITTEADEGEIDIMTPSMRARQEAAAAKAVDSF